MQIPQLLVEIKKLTERCRGLELDVDFLLEQVRRNIPGAESYIPALGVSKLEELQPAEEVTSARETKLREAIRRQEQV